MTMTIEHLANAKPGAKIAIGNGLRLDVDRNGNRNWVFRFTSPVHRRERLMGLGSFRDVDLDDAIRAAADARRIAAEGLDPIDNRKAQQQLQAVERQRASIDFQSYANAFISTHESNWKNDKHRQQWKNSLRDHAFPHIGRLPVASIDTDAVVACLRTIWGSIPVTAQAIRGRIEQILDAAKAEGLRTGDNPAVWKGHLMYLLGRQRNVVRHHAALPYTELPAFWRSLAADTSDAAALLRFTIATCARYGESAGTMWAEIDLDRKLWTIPGERMKTGREHVVPLNDAAMTALKSRTGTGLVFESPRRYRKMSDVSLAKCIRRHTALPATTHGFRSCFRDWAGDETDVAREVAEGCLAHAVGSAVEQAYRRGTALAKRRALMDTWSNFVTGGRHA